MQAGLTQGEVALRLGRAGPGGKSYVCRIERGGFPGLGFHVLGGFLQACGAGPDSITDTVAWYFGRPSAFEERTRKQVAEAAAGLPVLKQARVTYYDTFHKPAVGRRETPDEQRERRVREARGQVRSIGWERRLHRVWNDVLNELRIGCKEPLAAYLGAYGRKVFAALRRTRKARPVWREKAMAELDNWAAAQGLPPEPFVRMKQAVLSLFVDMERRGEFD